MTSTYVSRSCNTAKTEFTSFMRDLVEKITTSAPVGIFKIFQTYHSGLQINQATFYDFGREKALNFDSQKCLSTHSVKNGISRGKTHKVKLILWKK